MSLYNIFLPTYYSHLVKQQQQSVIIDNFYFFVGDGISRNQVADTDPKTIYDEQITINQIMYGYKISTDNLIAMIRKIKWQNGKIFAKFDSRDPDLSSKDFYCITSGNRIYKCIDNNKGAPSTVEPFSLTPGPFASGDGYIWTLMYSLTTNQLSNYQIFNLIPIFQDTGVISAAVKGTVSTIEVTNSGNYPKLNNGTIANKQSNTVFQIDNDADAVSGIYNDMGFYISNGPGVGSIAQINQYIANTSGKFVSLKQPLATATGGSSYEIAPYIKISGNGSGATARAIMSGTTIDKIELLNRGSNYTLASASASASASSLITPATLEVNLSPLKGHGGDPYQELYVDYVLLNIELDNYAFDPDIDLNKVPFSKIGFIRFLSDNDNPSGPLYSAPVFTNLFYAKIANSFGEFAVGDVVRVNGQDNPSAEIVYVDDTGVAGVYHTQLQRFNVNDTLVNQDGILGDVITIRQPDIRMIATDMIAVARVNTTFRDDDSRENVQVVVKLKDDITPIIQ